jgi:hypothetical protein
VATALLTLPRTIEAGLLVVDSPFATANTFPNGELSRTAEPHLHGAGRSDASGDTGATRAQGRHIHQRAGAAFHDPAIPEGTELTFIHSRLHDEETRRGHEEGWAGALDKLEAYFAVGAVA